MFSLHPDTLDDLSGLELPAYRREDVSISMVHIGVGGFHRAHQAVYTEQVLRSGDLRWGTMGASLRSTTTRDALAAQDYLYTVCTRDQTSESYAVHGGLLNMVTEGDALLKRLSDPSIKVVTLTITEKGYATDQSAVDGVPALLARALMARKNLDAPLSVLSCDNLTANGHVLRDAVVLHCDGETQGWVEDRVSFPNCMVDRITPQTTPEDIERVAEAIGCVDRAPVICEPFIQWIIEDNFRTDRPAWESGGAQFVSDVAPYEQAKLRLLNASHSLFAYLGLLQGYEFIHEAAADPALQTFVLAALRDEILPNIDVPSRMDAQHYVQSILQRFLNSAVPYRTAQVASDGSAKLPQRIYPTLQTIWAKGQSAPRLELSLCAWLQTLAGLDASGKPIAFPDPGVDQVRPLLKYTSSLVTTFCQHTDQWQGFSPDALKRMAGMSQKLRRGGLQSVLADKTDY